MVFQALAGLPGLEIVAPSGHIHSLPPAILKPRQRWTGKQVRISVNCPVDDRYEKDLSPTHLEGDMYGVG